MKPPQVVDGEASESDSELEVGKTPELLISEGPSNVQASVISGEASESDDEECVSPAKEATPTLPPVLPRHIQMCSNSLLHQRLWEVNVSMRRSIEVLGLHTMKIASERMTVINKDLLDAQEMVRVADRYVSLARANAKQCLDRLDSCHIPSALPSIRHKTEATDRRNTPTTP